MTFARDARGKVTGLTLHYRGQTFAYDKISDVPPKAPEPVKPPVIVNLDTNVLDACVGRYEVAPSAAFPKGLKVGFGAKALNCSAALSTPAATASCSVLSPSFPNPKRTSSRSSRAPNSGSPGTIKARSPLSASIPPAPRLRGFQIGRQRSWLPGAELAS